MTWVMLLFLQVGLQKLIIIVFPVTQRRRKSIEIRKENKFRRSTFDVDSTTKFQRLLLDVEKTSTSVLKFISKFRRQFVTLNSLNSIRWIDVKKSTRLRGCWFVRGPPLEIRYYTQTWSKHVLQNKLPSFLQSNLRNELLC